MTTSSILRLVSRRANKLSTVASHSHPTIIRSFSAAPAALASSTTNSETDIRGAAAVMVAAVAATGAGLISWKNESKRADCTAITAVVGKDGFGASKFLLDGLEKIQTRGYDGAGMATMTPSGGNMHIVKKSSPDLKEDPIKMVREVAPLPLTGHSIGIAHTRWATVGSITDKNAHPHTDASGKIAVVHNGSIFNKQEIRKELKELGYNFYGQTDTEVIAKLIGHYHEGGKVDIREATKKAMKRFQGTYGLAVMCSDYPEELVVTCHGSPLYIGVGDDGTFVASNPSAFRDYSRNFIKLGDKEVATIDIHGRNLDLTKMIEATDDEESVPVSPAPYPHWFIKEVMEQPQAIGRALCFGGRLSLDTAALGGLQDHVDKLKNISSILMVGVGSSYNAASYGAKLFKHAGVFANVSAMDANAAEDSDFKQFQMKSPKSGLVVLSQSGETQEVINTVQLAQRNMVPVMSVVNEVGSTVANMTKCGVYTNAGPENSFLSTKSFTSQVVCLALMSMWFRQTKSDETVRQDQSLAESLQRLPISFGMLMRTQGVCKKAAKKLLSKEHCFVLGKGFGEPIAMEGALKLKEIGYLHAEGYSGGALKHGPFAMIEDETGKQGSTPIIMLVFDDMHAHHMRTACEEVKARGAELIIITDNKKLADGLDDDPIIVPSNGPLTALGAVVPLQMIAYELAMLKGNNPDTPRSLLKYHTSI